MRVVLDTNVFIDAFFKDDRDCNIVLKAERNGEFRLLVSNEMQEELLRILGKSFSEFDFDGNEVFIIMKIISRALRRSDPISTTKKFTKCEDKDDSMFFECAIEGNANYIISRDKHIHSLKDDKIFNKNKEEIKILYPDEFVMELKKIKLAANFK